MKKSIIRTLLVFGLILVLSLGASCDKKNKDDNKGKTYTITYVLNEGTLGNAPTTYDGTTKVVLPTPGISSSKMLPPANIAVITLLITASLPATTFCISAIVSLIFATYSSIIIPFLSYSRLSHKKTLSNIIPIINNIHNYYFISFYEAKFSHLLP